LGAKHAEDNRPVRSRPRVPFIAVACSLLAAVLAVGWTLWRARHAPGGRGAGPGPAEPWPRTAWRNARPGVRYVGDAACARCHGEIAETFRRHPMGRSLAPVAAATAGGGDRSDGAITFRAGSSDFTIERRGGREVHRETRRDEPKWRRR
jgi:hypothetical protein